MDPDPIAQYLAWLADAQAQEPPEANAACLATLDASGQPRARIVLAKAVDDRGFHFYTNYESDKARELAAHPKAALCFHWKSGYRQVRVEGVVKRLPTATSDAYFTTRPRGSQLGAWASDQSQPIADAAALEAKFREVEARFEGRQVPRPPHWGGYALEPRCIEFWQGRENRMHDRWLYERDERGVWRVTRLQP